MSKTITTTFLLKNPKKVRELVAQGVKLLVQHNGKIVMEITLPKSEQQNTGLKPAMVKSNQPDFIFNREDLYNGKYDN
jgi:hypothetical protein